MTIGSFELNSIQQDLFRSPSFSDRFYQDPYLTGSFAALSGDAQREPEILAGDHMVVPRLFPTSGSSVAPLLDSTISDQIVRADSLELTTAAENQASGRQADYRLIEDENGGLVLERIGNGDPLADGVLNIETDAGGNSLHDAIMQNDKSLKEYYRELIAAWRQNHPDREFPGWWQDILNLEPSIQSDAHAVPIRQSSVRPQVQRQVRQPVPPRQRAEIPQGTGGGGGTGGGTGSGVQPSPRPFGGAGHGGGDGAGAGFDSTGNYRSGGETSDNSAASSGAVPTAEQETVLNNVRTVVEVAREVGVDPQLAVAMMLVESGGDNRAIGDNGTSFGLFQLHRGGMLTEANLTPDQAFDPRTNAEVSLSHLATIDDRYSDPGRAAAASQRPAHPEEYARRVNSSMDEAAELIAMAGNPTNTVSTNNERAA